MKRAGFQDPVPRQSEALLELGIHPFRPVTLITVHQERMLPSTTDLAFGLNRQILTFKDARRLQ